MFTCGPTLLVGGGPTKTIVSLDLAHNGTPYVMVALTPTSTEGLDLAHNAQPISVH